ncbi:hypothetical protein SHIRM173S_09087 [Streptomyces hirsutus]
MRGPHDVSAVGRSAAQGSRSRAWGPPAPTAPTGTTRGAVGAEVAVQGCLQGIAGPCHRVRERQGRGAHEDFVQRKVRAATAPKTTANATSPREPQPMSDRSPRPVSAADTPSLR